MQIRSMCQDHQPTSDQSIKEVRALHCFISKRALAQNVHDQQPINQLLIKLLEITTEAQQRKSSALYT